tara:strand:- start:723 stop:2495 length:1773 start_codon:yes stop_codon:yes gene_type:complete
MRYVSLFSGIEAASEAWHSMGWDPVAFADIDKFPSTVLAHHFPDVPNMGNVEEVDWSEFRGKADLVVGGSPCQSFSVAGKRLGMDDPRGNLALEFLRAVKEIQPTWFLFENVPGLLSSDGGRDFGIFLGEVAKIGYGFAYRVLDSQYFGVPQRRRRVFVVGHIGGDWRSAAAVLFERESLQGHSKESAAQGKAITDYIGTSTSGEGGEDGGGIDASPDEVGIFRKSRRAQSKTDCETWVKDTVTNTLNTFDLGDTRTTQIIREPIAFEQNQRSEVRETEVAGPVKAEKGSNNQTFIAQNWDGEDKTGTLTTRSMQQFMPDKDNFMAVVEPLHDPAPTLDASYYKGTGERAGIERQIIAESKVFDARGGGDGETANTLASGRNAAGVSDFTPLAVEGREVQVYENHPSDGRVTEVDTSPTITAKAGTGGGNLPLVKEETIGFDWKNAAQTNFDEKHSGAPVTAEGGLAVGITAKGNGDVFENEIHTSLSTGGGMPGQGYPAVRQSMAVRRLTPLECERLQGFTDGYTQIAWRNKAPENCPDGPRYKALGNSMAVPVMRWIGEGIQIVDDLVGNMTEREDAVSIVQKSIFDF